MRTHNKPLNIEWCFIKGNCKKRASAYLRCVLEILFGFL